MTAVMGTEIAFSSYHDTQRENKKLWTHFVIAFCNDEQPLKISQQSQLISEIKYCNY